MLLVDYDLRHSASQWNQTILYWDQCLGEGTLQKHLAVSTAHPYKNRLLNLSKKLYIINPEKPPPNPNSFKINVFTVYYPTSVLWCELVILNDKRILFAAKYTSFGEGGGHLFQWKVGHTKGERITPKHVSPLTQIPEILTDPPPHLKKTSRVGAIVVKLPLPQQTWFTSREKTDFQLTTFLAKF